MSRSALRPRVDRRIDILVPGLFGPVPIPPAGLPPMPGLERLLARSDQSTGAPGDPIAALFERFGIAPDPGQDPPSAVFCRLADAPGADPGGFWLHADPVHLHPDRDQLVLFDSRHLDLVREEADALVALFNDHFASDGLRLEAPLPGRWYLGAEEAPRIRTTPLSSAVGRRIGPLLPQGEEARRWARLLNEAQMLFHHAEVNRARERRGQPMVNAIWPWGGGRLPDAIPRPDYDRLYAGDPLAAGLGRAAGIALYPLAEASLDAVAAPPWGNVLVVRDGLWQGVLDADAAAWALELQSLEAWLAPLLNGLKSGRLARIELDPCTGACFRLTRRHLRRFWRRAVGLGTRLGRSN